MNDERRGYVYGLTAYVMWGFFPIYFKLLRPAAPLEILAHRVIWSVLFVSLVLAAMRNWRFLSGLLRDRRRLGGAALAAVFIGLNWATYIYGVNSSRVVETALGYFITPLVVVLLGVSVQRERLRAWQWVAVGVGTLAVAVLTVDYGRLPYIALILAATFGTYSLIKKRLSLPPAEGLFVESAVLALPALIYLGWLGNTGDAVFGQVSAGHTVLMMLAGVATAVPLLLFAASANRVSLVGMGMMQYVAPILQLACGVLLYREPMPAPRLAGFALVWVALIIFTVDGIRRARAAGRNAAADTESRRVAAGPVAATTEPAAALPPR
ncbi:chloramphenicol-sensitive protein RarD [Krasilnikovia cinnamomea]|uniref:Chloramphenicol-sensitive protein RarD n=1 Tax=Krasilnikovia cinnamomea TaxID=349313 RepID=A0A4Q7ZMD8_9ACTN|nr:EamA family transporter RarD [Krasilnikovia cinnamomea]RZU51515.1 chloramphenicol-sensitive protein RarD [Krasilnikovia cinnamomea]